VRGGVDSAVRGLVLILSVSPVTYFLFWLPLLRYSHYCFCVYINLPLRFRNLPESPRTGPDSDKPVSQDLARLTVGDTDGLYIQRYMGLS
jgi:hypothetical protein